MTTQSIADRSYPLNRRLRTALPRQSALMVGVFVALNASAASQWMRLRGVLMSDGEPFTGRVHVEVRLYRGDDARNPAWVGMYPPHDDTRDTEVSAGLFGFRLWRGAPDWDSLVLDDDLWLELVIDGKALSPRRHLWSLRYVLGGQEMSSRRWTAELDVWAGKLGWRFLPRTITDILDNLPDAAEKARVKEEFLEAAGYR